MAVLVRTAQARGQWYGNRTYSHATWKFPNTGGLTNAWHQGTWKREELSAYARSIGFTRVSVWNASEGAVLCEIATASVGVPSHECNGIVSVQEKKIQESGKGSDRS